MIKYYGRSVLWNDCELEILRQNYDGTHKQKEVIARLIQSQFGIVRSLNAIRHKASVEGLTNHHEIKPKWTKKQIDRLQALSGYYSPEQIALK